MKTLLVDTNRASYPIYRSLVSQRHEVWVVGGNSSEPLARMASNYVHLDYSDNCKLAAFVDEQAFDFMVPGCTDVSYKACAEISQERFPGIDAVEVTRIINNKAEFRRLGEKLGISVPKVVILDEAVGMDAVIVKPVDSFSGRGISILRQPGREELSKAYAGACAVSKTGAALIEEFVAGQLYSYSAFVRQGKCVAEFVVQEDCVADQFAVDVSRVAWEFPEELRRQLREEIERLAAELSLVDGLVHAQFISDGNKHWIIEVMRRCPGDLYSLLIEYSTGYPYAASYAAPFTGGEPAPARAANARRFVTRHTVCARADSFMWGLSFQGNATVKLLVPLAVAGQRLGRGPDGRAALAFFESDTESDQESLYRSLISGGFVSLEGISA